MLKITIEEKPGAARLKIEGRLCGPYVEELDRTWKALEGTPGAKQLSVDLCEMTGVDEAGKRLLAEMYRRDHVEFIARSVLTQFYAEQARQHGRSNPHRGEPTCAPRTFVN